MKITNLLPLVLILGCGINKEFIVQHGIDGKDGATGATGEQGPKGDTGANGSDGASCTSTVVNANLAAPNGGALITCGVSSTLILNGANGQTGAQGPVGATGPQGPAGLNGQNGTNGTAIVPIQFCSGTGSYPSTFPEIGFCINDHLYAVYSDHNGFLVEVLPGTWSSNGINSSCTFTVYEHCEVTR